MGTLVVIVGPTGVGKTELSLQLAEKWHCPIVNADSRQIYHDLSIGTAAPTEEEQRRVKHYFVGTHSLNESYNAGAYARDAVELLEQLQKTHLSDTPFALLTGGSMLYADAVLHGLDDIPATDSLTRERVQELYKEKGLEALQAEVQRLDPDYWTEVDRMNPQRLMHCVEVCWQTGKPYSSFRKRQEQPRPWKTCVIGLTRERQELFDRINRRVTTMMEQGLEDEARKAYEQLGCPTDLPNSLNTVGYREMIQFFRGEKSREEAVQLIQQNSRHYAKRQMTWFRAQTEIHWITLPQNTETIITHIEQLLHT